MDQVFEFDSVTFGRMPTVLICEAVIVEVAGTVIPGSLAIRRPAVEAVEVNT